MKSGTRGKGASACAKFDYICREQKYENQPDKLVYKQDGNMPEWVQEGRDYWEGADELERKNGRLYQEVMFALPVELDEEARKKLAVDFAQKLTEEHKQPYTLAIHEGKGNNPHAHLMLSERQNDGIERDREQWFRRANKERPERGGSCKLPEMGKRDYVLEVRKSWEEEANKALEREGIRERISCKSYAEQDKDKEFQRIPQIHLGPLSHSRMQRGGTDERIERYQKIESIREMQAKLQDELARGHELERALEKQLEIERLEEQRRQRELEKHLEHEKHRRELDAFVKDRQQRITQAGGQFEDSFDGRITGVRQMPAGNVVQIEGQDKVVALRVDPRVVEYRCDSQAQVHERQSQRELKVGDEVRVDGEKVGYGFAQAREQALSIQIEQRKQAIHTSYQGYEHDSGSPRYTGKVRAQVPVGEKGSLLVLENQEKRSYRIVEDARLAEAKLENGRVSFQDVTRTPEVKEVVMHRQQGNVAVLAYDKLEQQYNEQMRQRGNHGRSHEADASRAHREVDGAAGDHRSIDGTNRAATAQRVDERGSRQVATTRPTSLTGESVAELGDDRDSRQQLSRQLGESGKEPRVSTQRPTGAADEDKRRPGLSEPQGDRGHRGAIAGVGDVGHDGVPHKLHEPGRSADATRGRDSDPQQELKNHQPVLGVHRADIEAGRSAGEDIGAVPQVTPSPTVHPVGRQENKQSEEEKKKEIEAMFAQIAGVDVGPKQQPKQPEPKESLERLQLELAESNLKLQLNRQGYQWVEPKQCAGEAEVVKTFEIGSKQVALVDLGNKKYTTLIDPPQKEYEAVRKGKQAGLERKDFQEEDYKYEKGEKIDFRDGNVCVGKEEALKQCADIRKEIRQERGPSRGRRMSMGHSPGDDYER